MASAIAFTEGRSLPSPLPFTPEHKMQIDPTFDTEGNELADQIIQERATFAQIRGVLDGMDWAQKIAVAQIACNQLSAAEPVRLVKLEPFEKVADYELRAVATLMRLLPPETLAEIAIEILEEPRDRNE